MFSIIWILTIILIYGIVCHFKKDITAAFICYITVMLLGAFTTIACLKSRQHVDQKLALYFSIQNTNDSTEIAQYNQWLVRQQERNKNKWESGIAIPDYIEYYDTIRFKK